MRQEIEAALQQVAQKYKVRILYAVESGSRAWGFASPNSDWDVRFIYIHPTDAYLTIDEKRDVIEEMLPNDLDLSGWDIRKTLKLFRKSNPPLLEWLRSPHVYHESGDFICKLRELETHFFSPKSCMHHYLGMGHRNYKAYFQSDTARLKKYLYVLRPILACRWIENRDEMAPMLFQDLVDGEVKDEKVRVAIQDLLALKMAGDEMGEAPRMPILDAFIEHEFEYFKSAINDVPLRNTKIDTHLLDTLFRETLLESE